MQQFKRLLFSIVIAALLLGGHVRLVTAQERPPTTCGVTTWSQNIAVNAQPRTVITDLLLDSNDNAIVNGYTIRNDASIVKWFTRKYDASGLQVWEYQHPDAGRTVLPANVTTESVALDNDENVSVLRLVAGEKSTYAQLTRLAADDGALEWILNLEKIDGDENTYFNSTRRFVVQQDAIYIYGSLATLSEPPTSVLAIIRVSLNGELETVHQLPLYHWSNTLPSKTWAVDSLGNSVVAGLIPSQYGSRGLTIIKVDADNELLWERDVPEEILGNNNGEEAIELKIDSRNYIHVIVPFDRQDPDLGRINGRTLLNYDPDGNLVWHQDLQYMGAAIYQPQHMEIGLNDDLFVFDKPYDRGDGAPSPIHLLRYDKDGSFLNFVEMPEIPGVALGLKTSPGGQLTVWYGREVIENLVKTYTVNVVRLTPEGQFIDLYKQASVWAPERGYPQVAVDSHGTPIAAIEGLTKDVLLNKLDDGQSPLPLAWVDDVTVVYDDISAEQLNSTGTMGTMLHLDGPAIHDDFVRFQTLNGASELFSANHIESVELPKGAKAANLYIPIRSIVLPQESQQPAFSVVVLCMNNARLVDRRGEITFFSPVADRLADPVPWGPGFLVDWTFDVEGNFISLIAMASEDSSTARSLVKKFAADGSQIWSSQPIDGGFSLLAMDATGVYLAGQQIRGEDQDTVIVRLSHQGEVLWRTRYDAREHGAPYGKYVSMDHPIGIALDGSGGIYVAVMQQWSVPLGHDELQTYTDTGVVAIDASGDIRWVYRFDQAIADRPTTIAVDRDGMIYVIGTSYTGSAQNPMFWLKMGPDGTLHAHRNLIPRYEVSQVDPPILHVTDARVESDGSAYIIVRDSDPNNEFYTVSSLNHVSPEGDLRWTAVDPPVGRRYSGAYTSIAESARHDLIIAGGPRIVAFSQNGQPQWLQYGNLEEQYWTVGITPGSDRLLYIASEQNIVAFDVQGKTQWQQPLPSNTNPFAYDRSPFLVSPSGRMFFARNQYDPDSGVVSVQLHEILLPVGPLKIALSDVTIMEPTNGTQLARVPLQISYAADHSVQVKYYTVPGTAEASTDFIPQSGTLTLSSGETKAFIDIPILNSDDDTLVETFFVIAEDVEGAIVADLNAEVRIIDSVASNIYLPLIRSW